ncbi:hypothetical protein JKP88DRAFT_249861 [Tribonema minus]|uniref:Uncharacterized protein n=1 Tax=Tribonema minus TaxID=303371 RepID=A0A835YLT3_9STRA|nr:hypothetical protein JKP88DRAFT_249861 [Tribonema minus]
MSIGSSDVRLYRSAAVSLLCRLNTQMIEGMQHTKETATQKGADLQEQAAPAFERATENVKDLKNQTGTTASGGDTTSTTTDNATSGIPSELGSTTEGLPSFSAATDRDAQLPSSDSTTPLPVGPPAGGYMQGASPSAGDPFKDLSIGDATPLQGGSTQPLGGGGGGDTWRDAGGVTTSDAFHAAAPDAAGPPRPAGDYGLSTVTTSGEDADAVSAVTPQEQIRQLGGADKKFVGGHEVAVDTRGSGGGGSGGAEGGSAEGGSDDLRMWPPVSADQAGEVTTSTSQQRDADALAPEGSGATWRDAGGVATSDQFCGASGGAGDMLASSGGSGSGSAAAGTVTTSDQLREPSSGSGTDALSGATPDLVGSGAGTGTITTSDQFREPTSGGGSSGADLMSGGTSGERSGGTVTTSDQFRQPVDTGAGGEVEMSRDLGVTGSVTTSDQFRGGSTGGGGDGSGSASEHFTPGSGAVTAGHSDYGLPRGGFGNGTGFQETSSTQPEQQRSSGGSGGTGGSDAFVPRESATEQAQSAVLPLDMDLQRVSVSELAPSGGSAPQASGSSSSSEQQRGSADAGASEFAAPLDALAGDAAEMHEPSLLEKQRRATLRVQQDTHNTAIMADLVHDQQDKASSGDHFTPGTGAATAGHSDYSLPVGFGNGSGFQNANSTGGSGGSGGGSGGGGVFLPSESATDQAEGSVLPRDADLQRVSVSELAPGGSGGGSSSKQQQSGAGGGGSDFTAPLDALAGSMGGGGDDKPSLLEKVTNVFTRSG